MLLLQGFYGAGHCACPPGSFVRREKGSLDPQHYTNYRRFAHSPEKIEKIFEQKERIEQLSTRFTYAHNFIYLGRGINYPVALEEHSNSRKSPTSMQAICRRDKHGPIALIDEEMPIVVIATRDKIYEKVVSNIRR